MTEPCTPPVPLPVGAVRAAVQADMPRLPEQLAGPVAIPGIVRDSFDAAQLERSAEAVARILRESGADEVEIRRVPRERGGDGIMVHAGALRAATAQLGADVGLGVTVFGEGKEEAGSPSIRDFLAAHRDRPAADVTVVADSANWEVGMPPLTTSLRGMVEAVVEVSVHDHTVHSGSCGGPVLETPTLLARLIATFHDDDGAVHTVAPSARQDQPAHRPPGRTPPRPRTPFVAISRPTCRSGRWCTSTSTRQESLYGPTRATRRRRSPDRPGRLRASRAGGDAPATGLRCGRPHGRAPGMNGAHDPFSP